MSQISHISDVPYVYVMKPWVRTVLTFTTVTILVAGILGASYAAFGMTSLVKTWTWLAPLESLGAGGCMILFFSGGALGCGAAAMLFIVRYKPGPFVAENRFVELNKIGGIQKWERQLIQNCLTDGFDDVHVHEKFYAILRAISDKPGATDFITNIHGAFVPLIDNGRLVEIDTRFVGQQHSFEKMSFEPALEADIGDMAQLCLETIPEFDEWEDGDFFRRGNTPYVLRDFDQKIVAVICLQEVKENALCFHNLAIKVSAHDQGIASKLVLFMQSKESGLFYSQVHPEDRVALKIYSALGYKVNAEGDKLLMSPVRSKLSQLPLESVDQTQG